MADKELVHSSEVYHSPAEVIDGEQQLITQYDVTKLHLLRSDNHYSKCVMVSMPMHGAVSAAAAAMTALRVACTH